MVLSRLRPYILAISRHDFAQVRQVSAHAAILESPEKASHDWMQRSQISAQAPHAIA